MLTKFLPLPENNGGHQRSLAIARRLAELGDVVLCAYDDGTRTGMACVTWVLTSGRCPGAVTPTGVARGVRRRVASRRDDSGAPRWSRPSAVLPTRNRSTSCRSNISRWCRSCSISPPRQSILDLHNVESALVDSYARARSGLPAAFYRAEAAALRRMERRTIGHFDHVVVVSEKERREVGAGGRARSWSARTAVSRRLCCPSRAEPTVAFVATMGWAPNVDAAVWLGREIWPAVLARVPGARCCWWARTRRRRCGRWPTSTSR